MFKPFSLMLIVLLLISSPAFAQDVPNVRIPQSLKIQTATKTPEVSIRPAYLLPPQGASNVGSGKQSSGRSHKKRNIIIAVVAVAAVGVVIAVHSSVYGSGY